MQRDHQAVAEDQNTHSDNSLRQTNRNDHVAFSSPQQGLMGFMKGEMEIVGDIVSPASDPDDWEVLRD